MDIHRKSLKFVFIAAKGLTVVLLAIPYFIFAVIVEIFKGFGDFSGGGRSDYNIGKPMDTVRPESYRTMKRRNRLIRKFDHKNDPPPLDDSKNDP